MNDLRATLTGAKDGDERSFATLYRALQPGLLRYLRALVGDDAEDVAADAWLQIARDIGDFQGDEDGLRGWIATVGRNRAMDHLRKLRRRPVSATTVDDLTHLRDSPEDAADRALAAIGTDAAIAMIARLPQDQAEAVLLRVVMGLDATTAGRVLGKRAGAVRTAAYRGLRHLADTLAAPGIPMPRNRRHSGRGVTPARPATLKDMT